LPSNGAFFSGFKHLYKYTSSQQNRAIVELDPQQPLYYIKNLILLKKCLTTIKKYRLVFLVTDYKNIASNISFIKTNRFFNSRNKKPVNELN